MEPFLTADARRRGISAGLLTRLVEDGALWRPTNGVLLRSDDDGLLGRAAATALVLPEGAALCRGTAALLHGIDALPTDSAERAGWPIEVLTPLGVEPLSRTGVLPYQSRLPASDVELVGGLPVTTALRTACDLGRYLPRLEAVAALDQFLRQGLVSVEQLRAAAAGLAGRRWVAQLRERIDLTDPRAESPGESWSRVRVMDGGLPRPECQIPVVSPTGELAWLDMGWPAYRVGLEYDGEADHSEDEDVAHDRRRRGWVERLDWDLTVVGKYDVLPDRGAADMVEGLAEILMSRGWDPVAAELERLAERLARLRQRMRA